MTGDEPARGRLQEQVRVAILDDYQQVALGLADWQSLGPSVEVRSLSTHFDDEEALADVLAPFDVVVLMRERTPFPGSLLARLPRLRLIVTTGSRNASIDLRAAAQAGVTVCGTTSMVSPTVELTWALILCLSRNVVGEAESLRAGRWQGSLGEGVEGKTLGVIGLGNIGSRVARIATAFGMRVLAWSHNLDPGHASEVGAAAVCARSLFADSDVVTVHLRLSARTRGLIAGEELSAMKPSAYLVNTSRAEIVDQAALSSALAGGIIAGAAIDVFDEEPLPPGHPVLALPNTLLTPHLGYVVRQNYELFYRQAREDVAAYLGRRPIRVITDVPVG